MRCPSCGGYRFDSDERCLHCGYSVMPPPRRPSWWATGRWQKPKDAGVTPGLQKCPVCGEVSLFWNSHTNLYECLNVKCKRRFTVADLAGRVEHEPASEAPPEQSVPEEDEEKSGGAEHASRELLRCPLCGRLSLSWRSSTSLYHCAKDKCKRAFTESELRSSRQEGGSAKERGKSDQPKPPGQDKPPRIRTTKRTTSKWAGTMGRLPRASLRRLRRLSVMKWLGSRVVVLTGLIGAFLLYVSVAPMLFSDRNSDYISGWWDAMLSVGGFWNYLRIGFTSITLFLVCVGLLGVVISPFKPRSASQFMLWGGISGVSLLLALWVGLLDFTFFPFGKTDLASHLIWDSEWGVGKLGIVRELMDLGWIEVALIGSGFLLLGSLPRWWRELE